MGKTTYCSRWEKEYEWISRCKSDQFSAFCKVCNKPFSVCGSGIGQVKAHNEGKKHQKLFQSMKEGQQRSIIIGDRGTLDLSKSKRILTDTEKVLNAEVLQALHVTQYNISFSSAADHSSLFQAMFPDSAIAAAYKQSYTKISYILKFGIADYLKKQLIYDVKGVPYTFKFDETTTIQTKKQYDGYLQYWSPSRNEIVNAYCGSVFIGHCNHKDLVKHYREFESELELDSTNLLQLGMDGPNVNKKFATVLAAQVESDTDTKVLDIGTCSLHPVHTAYRKGLKELDFDFDGFFCDVHFFFKLSSARREDYALIQDTTDVVAMYAKKHSSTRWLSMKYVCLRVLEQLPNLKEYFLKFLPKSKQYNELKKTERYQRIRSVLANPISEVYLSFCAFSSEDFESFLLQFQFEEPMVHMLYDGMFTLLTNLMQKFIKKKVLFRENGDFITKDDLLKINVLETKNTKPHKLIDIGTKAKLYFSSSSLIEDESSKKFRTECLNFFMSATNYLMKSLPYDVPLIKQAQYLHHDKRNSPGATSGISNLALKIVKVRSKCT